MGGLSLYHVRACGGIGREMDLMRRLPEAARSARTLLERRQRIFFLLRFGEAEP
jgi:hypothetical protein